MDILFGVMLNNAVQTIQSSWHKCWYLLALYRWIRYIYMNLKCCNHVKLYNRSPIENHARSHLKSGLPSSWLIRYMSDDLTSGKCYKYLGVYCNRKARTKEISTDEAATLPTTFLNSGIRVMSLPTSGLPGIPINFYFHAVEEIGQWKKLW
jgi:hypothetical protein